MIVRLAVPVKEGNTMLTTTRTENAYELALENFDAAADVLGLHNNIREMIKYPERVLTVTVPVRMDDGHIHRFEAYRVQHSSVADQQRAAYATIRRSHLMK